MTKKTVLDVSLHMYYNRSRSYISDIFQKEVSKMFGKNKKLKAKPLEYWEESSYLLALTDDSGKFPSPDDIASRAAAVEGVKVLSAEFNEEHGVFVVTVSYGGGEHRFIFGPHPYSIPDLVIATLQGFDDEDINKLKRTQFAMDIVTQFGKEAKKDFHLQLKIAAAVMPDAVGYLDESQERVFHPRWAALAAKSEVLPPPSSLFTVQCVSSGDSVWLHTHGLCRCGLTEIEVLDSDREHMNGHYKLLSAFATYMIDYEGGFDFGKSVGYVGMLKSGMPVVVCCRQWTEALKEYKDLKLGGAEDRQDGHNTLTAPIFIVSPREEDNGDIVKVTKFDRLWDDDPVYFFTKAETQRMKDLAQERIEYAKKAAKNAQDHVLVKVGVPTDTEDHALEYVWFELIDFVGDSFKAKLTHEPYNVSSMHEGDECTLKTSDITDWAIYTKNGVVTPNEVYLLEN